MIDFGAESVAETMELAKTAAERISHSFVRPIKMVFERVYHPFLVMGKKKYAGMSWRESDNHEGVIIKGGESVRIDSCLLVSNTVAEVLDLILNKGQVLNAIDHAQKVIADLKAGKVDSHLLVMTKKDAQARDRLPCIMVQVSDPTTSKSLH